MHSPWKILNKSTAVVLLLALCAGLAVSWMWSGRVRGAQEQERRDLNLFLDASSAGWAEVTDQFFTIPESSAQVVSALVKELDTPVERSALLLESVRSSPAVDGAFIGYPNGEFMFVARSDEAAEGGFRTRTITIDASGREVKNTWTDPDFNVMRSEIDNANPYDPRERPWYISDGEADRWTDPYIFSSSQQPGITYSRTIADAAGRQIGVVGIDMRLSRLGEFLEVLAPGENGQAMVVRSDGTIIAASGVAGLSETGGIETAKSVDELLGSIDAATDADRMIALERSSDGLHTSVTRAARANRDWYLNVDALDSDFLGDFSNGSLENLLGLVTVGSAAALIVGWLAHQASRYRRRLEEEAQVDELTGALTRRAVRRAVIRRMSKPGEIAIGIIDLDSFKSVNDNHGHPMGDVVLAQLAARMRASAEAVGAVCGRHGGDEFCIVSDANHDWEGLSRALAEPVVVGDQVFKLGGSIGVAVADVEADTSVEELLRTADRALFGVKRAGGGGFEVVRVDAEPADSADDLLLRELGVTPPREVVG